MARKDKGLVILSFFDGIGVLACFYHTLRPLVDRLYRYIAVELADRAHEVLVARNPGFERCGFQFWALFVPTITVAFTKMPSGYALLDGARRRLA